MLGIPGRATNHLSTVDSQMVLFFLHRCFIACATEEKKEKNAEQLAHKTIVFRTTTTKKCPLAAAVATTTKMPAAATASNPWWWNMHLDVRAKKKKSRPVI